MKTTREQHIMSERNGHTVRVKTSELTGEALRYAVAVAAGFVDAALERQNEAKEGTSAQLQQEQERNDG